MRSAGSSSHAAVVLHPLVVLLYVHYFGCGFGAIEGVLYVFSSHLAQARKALGVDAFVIGV